MNQTNAREIVERFITAFDSLGIIGYSKVFAEMTPEDLIQRYSWAALADIDRAMLTLEVDLPLLRLAVQTRQQCLGDFFRSHGWPEFENSTAPLEEYRRCRDERARKAREAREKDEAAVNTEELDYQRRQVEAGFPIGGRHCIECLDDQKAAIARGMTICEGCGLADDVCENLYCGRD